MKNMIMVGALSMMLMGAPANANGLVDAAKNAANKTVEVTTKVVKGTVAVTKKVLLVPVKGAEALVSGTKELLQ